MIVFFRFFPLLMILTIFTLDRVTKFLVKANMFYGQSHEILPFFNLIYIENTGAAFGMGQNRNIFFIVSSVLILIILFVFARKVAGENVRVRSSLALVIGGALGNLYDRIRQGSVTDFLDFYLGSHHWPAFNVADSSIFVGAVLLVVFEWREKRNV